MNETTGTPAPAPAAGPGALLAARREELNWSVEQVAGHLNLAPRQVRAIEADDFSVLPVMAITRGFIRSYAKLLELDAAPLLAMIASESAPAEPEIAPRGRLAPTTFSASPGIAWKRQPSKWPLVAGAVLLAALAAGAAYQLGWLPLGGDMTARVGEGLARFPHAGPKAPEAVEQGTVSQEIAPPPISLPPENGAAPSQATAAAPAPAAAAPSVPAAAAGAPTAASAPAGDALVLTLREDSWVEIQRAGKPPLISRVLKAGSTETFRLEEPVTLVIGNASGVDASLRGEPVELKSKAKNNVARVSLK